MHQTLDGASSALHIDEQGGGNLIPVPRVIPMVLMMAFDFTSIHIEGEHRRGVEIVSRMHICRPGCGVPRPPIDHVELWIVVTCAPCRHPTSLPGLARPGVVARLAGTWDS